MQRCHRAPASVVAVALWALVAADMCAQTTVSVSAAPPATPTFVAPVAAPRPGLLGGLGGCCGKCKAKLKASPLCALIKNALKPLSAATGGLICGGGAGGPAAPGGPGEAGAAPPAPACAAEAKIKADAAQAAARRDAVKFLGTVDCHWYPEAEAALIASLRCDRSECVRMEAALALGRGCCCTKNTVEALRIAASGTSRDGNPGERCARVRWAALDALQTCLCNCGDGLPETPYGERPENPPEPLAPGEATLETNADAPQLQPYYAQLAARPANDVLRDARATVANYLPQQPPIAVETAEEPAQGEGIVGLWRGTRQGSTAEEPTMVANQPVAMPLRPSTTSLPTEIIAQPQAAPEQLRRLPTPSESSPEPVFLSRQPSGATYR